MSLTITVRPNGATSGGDTHELPAAGDNGNQEIDTQSEAEAALTYLPEGSTDTVVVGERSYTREELVEIRDRNASSSSSSSGSGETVMGDGPSHGFFIEGFYAGGAGDRGHSGGGARIGYRGSLTLAGGEHRLTLDPSIGLEAGYRSTGFMTPGGEAGTSAFTNVGAILGADLRYAPPILEHRLWASIGARFGVGGFGTAASNTVNLPTTCTPDDLGRGECEPDAGPRTGNAGTAGLYNPSLGAARGTDGAYFYFGGRITVGGDIARGDFGSISLYGAFEPGYFHLMPSDGHAFGFPTLAGILGLSGSFGGNAVERPPSTGPIEDSGTIDATATPVAAEANEAGRSAISLSADEVRDLANLPAGATIHGVALDGGTEDTSAPYEFEATPGEHTLSVRYSRPGETQERLRTVRIRVGSNEPITIPEGGTGEAYGMVLTMPDHANRPADDMIDGHAVPRAIPLGNIQTTAEFPEGAMYTIYVDGNPVSEPAELPRDRTTTLSLPPTVGDGPHQVEVRVSRPNGAAEIRYPARAVEVGPGTHLGTPPPALSAPSYNSRLRGAASPRPAVILNMTGPVDGVTISVNGYTMSAAEFNGHLSEGRNEIFLVNPAMPRAVGSRTIAMRSNVSGVAAGSYPVVINIPGEDPITLQLVIDRPGGGGGGGRGGPPTLSGRRAH